MTVVVVSPNQQKLCDTLYALGEEHHSGEIPMLQAAKLFPKSGFLSGVFIVALINF
jgi:hypothetical protein